jgi:class 3 adenylate cyclase
MRNAGWIASSTGSRLRSASRPEKWWPAISAPRGATSTVIGDPVNEAARLLELAKTSPSRLLASEAIIARARDSEANRWRLGEPVILRGRDAATRVA